MQPGFPLQRLEVLARLQDDASANKADVQLANHSKFWNSLLLPRANLVSLFVIVTISIASRTVLRSQKRFIQ